MGGQKCPPEASRCGPGSSEPTGVGRCGRGSGESTGVRRCGGAMPGPGQGAMVKAGPQIPQISARSRLRPGNSWPASSRWTPAGSWAGRLHHQIGAEGREAIARGKPSRSASLRARERYSRLSSGPGLPLEEQNRVPRTGAAAGRGPLEEGAMPLPDSPSGSQRGPRDRGKDAKQHGQNRCCSSELP
jgi:hypothetical protein